MSGELPTTEEPSSKLSATTMNGDAAPAPAESSTSTTSSPIPSASSTVLDGPTRGEELKNEGNEAFKAGLYGIAIDKYSAAIAAHPTEPTYYTNRAASQMALKRFKLALEDCQQAATLQSASPSVKTLIRLARCQVSLGTPTPALSTLRQVLDIEAKNATAVQLQRKAKELEDNLAHFHSAKKNKNWGVARIALDQCFRSSEGGEADAPSEWRCWRIQMEIARGNWDNASEAAK